MKRDKKTQIMLLFMILLFMMLFIFVCMYIYITLNEENYKNDVKINTKNETENLVENLEEENPVKAILRKHNSEYIKETGFAIYKIYVKFGEDLFLEDGKSNEVYFVNIIDDLIKMINRNFYLIDEEKYINIEVIFNSETNDYKIKYNDNENFFQEISGEKYYKVDYMHIVQETKNMKPESKELSSLSKGNMMFDELSDKLDSGIELENGYISYLDNSIIIKKNNGRVRNIIYTDRYTGEVVKDIKVGTDISEILDKYPDPSFGSIAKGYLGYRTETNYIFFYEDEISIWEYFYYDNYNFEKYLKFYLESNDLKQFIKSITDGWKNYKFYEQFNEETNSVHIIYPTRGIEIEVHGEQKNITIYSNYYITDVTKKLAKENKINVSTEDSIEKEEIERRNLEKNN